MNKGYKTVFIGLLFLSVHFTLGEVRILPECISYLIIFWGVYQLSQVTKIKHFEKSMLFLLLNMTGRAPIGIINIFDFNKTLKMYMFVYTAMMIIIDLLWIFYFFEGTIEALEKYGQGENVKSVSEKQKCYVIAQAIIAVLLIFITVLQLEVGVVGFVVLFSVLLRVFLIVTVYNLTKYSYEKKEKIIF